MPNHITNILKASKEVLDALISRESPVDFNAVIPFPSDVQQESLNGRIESLARLVCGEIPIPPEQDDILGSLKLSNAIRDLKEGGAAKLSDADFDAFVAMMRCFRKCRAFYWYDWNIQNWGTKWNAYAATRESETLVRFDTAWNAPHPVIEALASRFPTAAIEHSWADEDIGSNCGRRTHCGSAVVEDKIEDPVDFALTIKGRDRENYRPNPTTGLWEYYDPEEPEVISG